MIVQIYEVQIPSEAQSMIDLGVDHIGSVLLSEKQWQDEILKQTVATIQAAGRKSSLIPLFRDVAAISRVIEFYRPDIIHFCETLTLANNGTGDIRETLSRQKTIRDRFPDIEIMRSIPIAVSGGNVRLPSLEMAAMFEPISDWFLTDTVLVDHAAPQSIVDQPVAGFVGITGQTCDWEIARELVEISHIPVVLAGGISPTNTAEGIQAVRPAGVDSCTQTNALDDRGRPIRFKKNRSKVLALVQAAQQASGKITAGQPPKASGQIDAAPTV